jgi:hypothetical protein
MAFPVSIIMEQFRKFPFPSSQLAWRRSKTVPIGTVASGIHFKRIGNDFRVSHIKIEPAVLEIWLVVDSSLSQHINRDEQISIPSADPKDACVPINRLLG